MLVATVALTAVFFSKPARRKAAIEVLLLLLLLLPGGRQLPGKTAAPDTYPGKDGVASYLQAYTARLKLPVGLNTHVTSLTKNGGTYVPKAGDDALEARQVVVATGPFHVPFVPPIAENLDPGVHQVHSAHYRPPQTVPPWNVLVVGAANSGCQIAQELGDPRHGTLRWPADPRDPAAAAGPRHLDVGDHAAARPGDRRLAARKAPRGARPGDRPRAPRLARRHGIRLRTRAVSTAGRTVTFADGTAADYDAVLVRNSPAAGDKP